MPGRCNVFPKLAFVMSRENSTQVQTSSCLRWSQNHSSEHGPWFWAFLVAKNLPEMPETWLLSFGWQDPLEKEMTTLSLSPWDCKEIKPVNSLGNQPWIFLGRTDSEVEAPISWPPDGWFIVKDPDEGMIGERKWRGWPVWDGWMAWPTQWTWIWANSVSWWWTVRPSMLQSVGSQRVTQNLVTQTWGDALTDKAQRLTIYAVNISFR